jgi:tetratricopeptide (TPR) repeat protein
VQGDAIARRNQFVIYLARASMELSLQAPADALESLDLADALFHLPGNIETLESTYAAKNSPDAFTQADLTEDYEALLTGLRARALTAQGKFEEAKAPTERRLVLMQQRSKRDGQKPAAADDQRFMALIDLNLAVAAYKKGDVPGAIARIELGLSAGDDLAKRTATPLHHVIVALLALYAEMHFAGQVPLKRLKLDLPRRLARAYAEMVDHPQPRFEGDRAQFSIYLNRLMLEGVAIQIP